MVLAPSLRRVAAILLHVFFGPHQPHSLASPTKNVEIPRRTMCCLYCIQARDTAPTRRRCESGASYLTFCTHKRPVVCWPTPLALLMVMHGYHLPPTYLPFLDTPKTSSFHHLQPRNLPVWVCRSMPDRSTRRSTVDVRIYLFAAIKDCTFCRSTGTHFYDDK